jgi:hypothetical protein
LNFWIGATFGESASFLRPRGRGRFVQQQPGNVMDDRSLVLDALAEELEAQGHGMANNGRPALRRYPIKGTIDLVALAEAVENALRGGTDPDDAKAPAELNATNDG